MRAIQVTQPNFRRSVDVNWMAHTPVGHDKGSYCSFFATAASDGRALS